jgi:hypothetical protein
MTEAEWVSCNDPKLMLGFLHDNGRVGERKLRLFAAACCRRIWHLLEDGRSRTAVEVVERYADGEVGIAALRAAQVPEHARVDAGWAATAAWCAAEVGTSPHYKGRDCVYRYAANTAAREACNAVVGGEHPHPSRGKEEAKQAGLVRDIFGNPFHTVTIKPAWLTPTVTGLALTAYEVRGLPSGELDEVRLAILADSLEEAGCMDAAILGHLRSAGSHCRGCWAVDVLLAKD